MIPCPACGRPMPSTTRLGDPRRGCSRICVNRLINQAKWRVGQERCEDAASLLEQGESAEHIAARMDTTLGALTRLLFRHGFRVEAVVFERGLRRQRRAA